MNRAVTTVTTDSVTSGLWTVTLSQSLARRTATQRLGPEPFTGRMGGQAREAEEAEAEAEAQAEEVEAEAGGHHRIGSQRVRSTAGAAWERRHRGSCSLHNRCHGPGASRTGDRTVVDRGDG